MSIRKGSRIIAGSGGGNGESISNQNPDSSVRQVYDWIGTLAEYYEQDIDNTHPEWVCFVTDDSEGEPYQRALYTNRNVGDIFYTTRLDEVLNGAVECNGETYNIEDFLGDDSIGQLLVDQRVPYVSLDTYASLLLSQGSVGVFGWDGGATTEFRVPTLTDIFIEASEAAQLGNFISAGLPNITGATGTDVLTTSFTNLSGAFYGTTQNTSQAGNSWGTGYHTLNFDASRSSSIYGAASTVQPTAVKYRPMVQLSVGFSDQSVEDCTRIADHAILDNTISTAVTKIPQDIKLTLENGTLTLHKGSVLYFPNGFESDGVTRKFDKVITEVDKSWDIISGGGATYVDTETLFVYIDSEGVPQEASERNNIDHITSGPNAPTIVSGRNYLWYDTTNNIIKYYKNSEGWKDYKMSLPLAAIDIVADVMTNIKEVYNGMGYVASILYVLPGVEGLAPNGRNADGTYRNVKITTSKVLYEDLSSAPYSGYKLPIYVKSDDIIYNTYYFEQEENPDHDWSTWYNPKENIVYNRQAVGYDIEEYTPFLAFRVGFLDRYLGVAQNVHHDKIYRNVSDQELTDYKKQSVDEKNISNCIKYIPQDIKFELDYTTKTLILKSGSKVWYPDGLDENNNRKFSYFVTYKDISLTLPNTDTGNNTRFVYLQINTQLLGYNATANSGSGTTFPAYSSTNFTYFYNTATNTIRNRNTSADWLTNTCTFPLCRVDTSDGAIINIQSIYNGFGYIGQTTFTLPGLTCLFADGRNPDGTVKNKEITNGAVYIHDLTAESSYYGILQLYNTSSILLCGWGDPDSWIEASYLTRRAITAEQAITFYNMYTNEVVRRTVYSATGAFNKVYAINIGALRKVPNEIIERFHNKRRAFIAADKSDTRFMSNQAMPSEHYIDLELGASDATYVAPEDGYFMVAKSRASNDGDSANWLRILNTVTGLGMNSFVPAGSIERVWVPAKKGDEVQVSYTTTGNVQRFRFVRTVGSTY